MKKLTKILILILSIALIAGAVAVMASANAGQDNVIEFYVNGEKDANVTTYADAYAAVQKGVAGGATFTIKLLGNLTPTFAWKTNDTDVYNIGADTIGVNDQNNDQSKREVIIDLNGYTLDVSGIADVPFQSQRSYRNLTITGSGNIVVGAKQIFISMSGSVMSIKGTGYGIKMTNKGNAMPWNLCGAGGSGCAFNFENVDMEFHAIGSDTAKTFLNPGKSNVTFKNCRILLDYVRTAPTSGNNQGQLQPAGGAFISTCNDGIFKFYNTSIITSTYGINNSGTGANLKINGVTDKVSVYMENSSLKCMATEGVIKYYQECKAAEGFDKFEQALRAQITAGGWGDDDGNVYLKDSYIGGTYRSMYGYSEQRVDDVNVPNTATNPAVLILDGSTIEHIAEVHDLLGENKTNSGQGLYGSIVYTDYINGSTIKFGGPNLLCGGSGSAKSLAATGYNGPANANGSYAVDLTVGTRVDKVAGGLLANSDRPEGTEFVKALDNYYYLADAELKAKIEAEKAAGTTIKKNASLVRAFGFFTITDGVANWTVPTSEQTGFYNTNNQGSFNNDGTAVMTNSTYLDILTEANYKTVNGGGTKSVVTYTLDMYAPADNTMPLEIIMVGSKVADGKTGYVWNRGDFLSATGKYSSFFVGAKTGEWNTLTIVVDLQCDSNSDGTADCIKLYIYCNGNLCGAYTKTEFANVRGLWIQWGANKAVKQGASFTVRNYAAKVYDDYVGGSFNIDDYVEFYKEACNAYNFAVGNTYFTNADDALKYAAEKGGYVTVLGDVDIPWTAEVTTEGYINAGSYKFAPSTTPYIKATEIADGMYKFEKLSTYDVSFVVGGNTYTETVLAGNKVTVPQGVTPDGFISGSVAYSFAGWATTFVDYNGKTAAEYTEATKDLAVITNEQIAAAEVTETVTYYPVYTVSEIAFSVSAGGNTKYFGSDADFMLELAKFAANNTTTTAKLYASLNIEKDYVDWKGTNANQAKLDELNAKLPEGTDPYPLYNAKGNPFTGYTDNKDGTYTANYDGDQYVRTAIIIDLGGNTITFNQDKLGAKNNIFSTARGNITVKNGSITVTSSNPDQVSGAFASVHFGTAFLKMENVTYTGGRVASTTNQPNKDHNPYIILTGCTFYSTTAKNPMFRTESGGANTANKELVATDCTFYADYAFAEGGPNASVNEFNNCTFIASKATVTPIAVYVDGGFDAPVLNNCVVYGTVRNVVINGTTVAAAMGENVTTTDTAKVIGYVASTVTIGDKTYDMTVAVNSSAFFTSATFLDWNGDELVTIRVANTEDPLAYAPVIDTIEINAAINVINAGWEDDGLGAYAPVAEAIYTDAFANGGAFVNIALTNSFDVTLYIAAEYAEFISGAILSENTVTIGDVEYYYVEAIALNANEAYKSADFAITLVGGEYTVDVNYSVTIAAYLDAALAATEDKLCYVIAEYLADACVYFGVEDTILAGLVEKYADIAPEITAPTVSANTVPAGVKIGVDLTSVPAFVIKNETGADITVSFCGETITIANGATDTIGAYVNQFDNVVRVEAGDAVGYYTLGNYAESIANDAGSSEALKALVASFYNYILFANN